MSLQLKCPKCGSAAEVTPGERSPSSCPRCGCALASTDGDGTLTESLAFDEAADEFHAIPALQIPGFLVCDKIGHGGMGMVYRARQLSLQREVALKVLTPELMGDASALARFHHEAKLAGALTNSHILPLFDIVEAGGAPVLVMPYIAGRNLAEIIAEHRDARTRLSGAALAAHDRAFLSRMLPLLDQLLEAVAVIHDAGIWHRDIKPSNLLVDAHGHLWLADFGLAQLGRDTTAGGKALGTPGYMSPEQAGAADADARSDIFSAGATMYRALTGELPFGKKAPRLDAAPAPPSRKQSGLSPDLDAVILKALAPDRARRYPTARDLCDDWRRAREGLLPRARDATLVRRWGRTLSRHRWMAGALTLAVVAISLTATFALWQPSPRETCTIHVTTEPSGARLALAPIDEYGDIRKQDIVRPSQKTPLVLKKIPVGNYLVVVDIPGHGFHEVYRTVPAKKMGGGRYRHDSWKWCADGSVELPKVEIPRSNPVQANMILIQGGDFVMGTNGEGARNHRASSGPAHVRSVASYYLDSTEVTVARYESIRPIPQELQQYNHGNDPSFKRCPVTFVRFDLALEMAELLGKRLPTEQEYEYAASDGGQRLFPWGDDPAKIQPGIWPTERVWPVEKIDFDKTPAGVRGLFTNVAEWTDSFPVPYNPQYHPSILRWGGGGERYYQNFLETRVVRGGVAYLHEAKFADDLLLGVRFRFMKTRSEALANVGFRCARSATPRFIE